MKIENTPLSMKPPMLPSGSHLQIPAHAKVKTLPVPVFPPVIQNKILATAAALNTSGTGGNINAPMFVSPVNTVKMSASESLETKPVGQVSSSLILATPQKFINSSAIEVSTSGSIENKRNPIKWVVHENPDSSTYYIAPVKSSIKVASKHLKTLTNMKNTKNNSTSILPICSSSSHAKMPSASSHDNLQIRSISQHEAVSPARSASIGINVAHKYVTRKDTYDSSRKDLPSKAATDPTSPSLVYRAVKEEEQQAKMTSGMPIWMKHMQEQQKKHLQLNKIGLSKEVYLRRVPSKNSEVSVFSNSVQINDIDNLMSTPMNCESEKETMIGEQGGNLNIKKKKKVITVLENPKKRKNVITMQNSNFESSSSYSVMENLNNSCIQNLPEQEQSTNFLQCPHNVCNNSEENRVLNSTSNCHESGTALGESSFKKDIFPISPPDLEETIQDEKITRLKRLLKERDAALEAIRKKMHQC